MKARVDKEKCIGCGICVDICSEVFELEEDGLATAKNAEISEIDVEAAKKAIELCPAEAITTKK